MVMSLFKLKIKDKVNSASNTLTLEKVKEDQAIAKIEPREYPHKTHVEVAEDLVDKHINWLNRDYGNLAFFINDERKREIYKSNAKSLNFYVKFRKPVHLISNIGFLLIVVVGVFAKTTGNYAITWTSLAVLALIFSIFKFAAWSTVVLGVNSVMEMSNMLKAVKAFEKIEDYGFRRYNSDFQELAKKHDELCLPDIRHQEEAVKYYNFFNIQCVKTYSEGMLALWSCFTITLLVLCICILFSESAQSLIDYLRAWWIFLVILPAVNLGGYLYLRIAIEPELNKEIYAVNSKKILYYSKGLGEK